MAKITLKKGDITKLAVDAIVNAANSSLLGGGGVDGAIHRTGGKAILEECRKIRIAQGRCHTGEAVMTTAGNLEAKKVIHTVGPIWGDGGDGNKDRLLANCYKNSLQLAADQNFATIAFPNISTGVYGFPKERAAQIAIRSVRSFLENTSSIEEVIFICFDDENYSIYQELIK